MPVAAELAGRTAIVSGGSRGIVRAIAAALASAGVSVTITGLDAAKRPLGERVAFVRANQASADDWSRGCCQTKRTSPPFHVLLGGAVHI